MTQSNLVSQKMAATIFAVSIVIVVISFGFTRDNTAFARNVGIATQCYWCPDGYAAHQSVFRSENGTTYPTAPIPIELESLTLSAPLNPAADVPLPPPGDTTFASSFFDVFTEINLDGIPVMGDERSLENVNYRLTNANPPGAADPDPIDVEILQLHLHRQIVTIEVEIREQLPIASAGGHSIVPLPDGTFEVDSFFDIFTEISLDGGATWHQSSGPMRISFVGLPEPGTMIMSVVGLAGLIATVRRFKRS